MKAHIIDLTIVIPAYKEALRIGASLDELALFLKLDKYFKTLIVEVVVVVADSPDGTYKLSVSKQALFTSYRVLKSGPVVGKGRDVRYGMLRAKGQIVVYMDADFATPIHHLEKFYKACIQGTDIVIGTRNLLKHHTNFLRRAISNTGNIMFRIAGGMWIEDSQCGFKMFNEQAAQLCFNKMTILGWGFDMEILTIAKVNNFKIKSYRINDWKDVLQHSTFTDPILKVSLRSLKDLGRIVRKRANGSYRF